MSLAGCFDIDGTLLDDVGPRAPHDGPARRAHFADPSHILHHVTPHPLAVARAAYVARRGPIAFVTGREEHLRLTLTAALQRAGLAGELHLQPVWEGFPALLAFKTARLRALRPPFYVGDTNLDRDAAKAAGVPFLHADQWRSPAWCLRCWGSGHRWIPGPADEEILGLLHQVGQCSRVGGVTVEVGL